MDKIAKSYSGFFKTISKEKNTVHKLMYVCVSGSYSYGTNTSKSDVDIRGSFVANRNNYLGLQNIRQVEVPRADDKEKDTIYELRNFVRLALANNPNVIEQLFVNVEHQLYVAREFWPLIENRQLFLSKKCKYTYSGYAYSQLKRIQGHYQWISNPPKCPIKQDYIVKKYRNNVTGKFIPEGDYINKKIRAEKIVNSGKSIDKQLSSAVSPDKLDGMTTDHNFGNFNEWELVDCFDEKNFKLDASNWEKYLTWKENRNEARSKLEEKFYYDVKHASHLVRLLLQGKQILGEHKLDTHLKGENLNFVRDVLEGKYSYPKLIEVVEALNNDLNVLYEKSELRSEPKTKEIEEILVEILKKEVN